VPAGLLERFGDRLKLPSSRGACQRILCPAGGVFFGEASYFQSNEKGRRVTPAALSLIPILIDYRTIAILRLFWLSEPSAFFTFTKYTPLARLVPLLDLPFQRTSLTP
jgi:hypothetical protein